MVKLRDRLVDHGALSHLRNIAWRLFGDLPGLWTGLYVSDALYYCHIEFLSNYISPQIWVAIIN